MSASADSTTKHYTYNILKWNKWSCLYKEVNCLPAKPLYIALYLLSISQISNWPASILASKYALAWFHKITGFPDLTSHHLVQFVLESFRRKLGRKTTKIRHYNPRNASKMHFNFKFI